MEISQVIVDAARGSCNPSLTKACFGKVRVQVLYVTPRISLGLENPRSDALKDCGKIATFAASAPQDADEPPIEEPKTVTIWDTFLQVQGQGSCNFSWWRLKGRGDVAWGRSA